MYIVHPILKIRLYRAVSLHYISTMNLSDFIVFSYLIYIFHSHLVPRLSMSRSYTSSPACASMACNGITLLFYIL
jgi:hypothetical protein